MMKMLSLYSVLLKIKFRDDSCFCHTRYTVRSEVISSGAKSDLSIKTTDRTDSGLFSCRATNAFGSDETSINLIVQGE